ncbi:uncharacterized protein TNIN_67031 [Trichonephila inaurata madagascariensis]|uniref:Uncharacterized protein n=1 Tax=Trichonephila inaurata madagascariensis TaxID=2747483 RepID=A0A8X6X557_9ARAC|nr:uncharacterized protein TNIN_67031 [Trichonephila inaurata madagascariensis]
MYVFPPVLQDLSLWESTRSTKVWEVSTPPKNSISWSIVLSYVITSQNPEWHKTLLGDEKEIAELMGKKNLGRQKLNFKSIKDQIQKFNPFKNQHSFFFNKDVIKIIRMFDLKLNRFSYSLRKNSSDWCDNLKFTAAAKMLNCYVEVFEMDSSGNKVNVTTYPPLQHDDSKEKIILFQHTAVPKKLKSKISSTQDEKITNMFAFGLSLEHVFPLRRDALGHILKRAKLDSPCIQNIKRSFNYTDNFLVFLLKNSLHEIVPSLFVSPYIAWKLEAAGFNTDPCSLGPEQLSAFYYCLNLDSTLNLHVLYNYASNNIENSDKTTRNPDQETQRALTKIEDTLQKDRLNSKDFSIVTNRRYIAFKTFEEILCFNEYQRFIVDEVNNLRKNRSLETQHNTRNVQFTKKIIIHILDMYFKYFNYPKEASSENKYGKFKIFIKSSEYYENLDNYTCLLFFDHCLFLPKSTENLTDTVHNLFLTVFAYNLFPKCLHGVHCLQCDFLEDPCTLRFIPFSFRLNFFESARALFTELKNSPENIPKSKSKKPIQSQENSHDPGSIVSKITDSLKYIPEIKNHFLIDRLRRYLEFSINVPLNEDEMNGVLTIERALQVIGETLNTTESSCIIGHLLCSCFPKDVLPDFFKIRNHCLSKYRPRTMNGKFMLEKDIFRFDRLQNVMKQVYHIIQPVYLSQLFRIQDFMIKKGLHESEGVHEVLSDNMKKEHNGITRLIDENFKKYKSKYKLLSNNLLDYVENDERKVKNSKLGQLTTLKFLFTFFGSYCDERSKNELSSTLNDMDELKKVFESKTTVKKTEIDITADEKQCMTKIISSLRTITVTLFADVDEEPNKISDFRDITDFLRDSTNFNWFSEEEMILISNEVSNYFMKSCTAKEDLKKGLEDESLTPEKAKKLVEVLITTEKNKKILLENFPQNASKALGKVGDEQSVNDLNKLIAFLEKEEGSNLLLKMNFSSNLKKKILQFLNRRLELLLNRISHIRAILIDGDEEISQLWNWGKSEGMKAHVRYLMAQRYWKERDVRASLEMLLFDCMNILKTRDSLSHLWTKANNLFTGASLRDVLSHGNTILETVGSFLDKDDLPSHFIEKMLELIEDSEALQCFSDLWEKSKLTDFNQFVDILNEDVSKDNSLHNIQKWMEKRSEAEGWQDYLFLLPLKKVNA